jgi:hypothetical protein
MDAAADCRATASFGPPSLTPRAFATARSGLVARAPGQAQAAGGSASARRRTRVEDHLERLSARARNIGALWPQQAAGGVWAQVV